MSDRLARERLYRMQGCADRINAECPTAKLLAAGFVVSQRPTVIEPEEVPAPELLESAKVTFHEGPYVEEHDEITLMSGRVCRGGTCD